MRRVVIELSRKDAAKLTGAPPLLDRVKSLKVLSFLRMDLRVTSLICRIKLQDPSTRIETLLPRVFPKWRVGIKVLEQNSDRDYTVFLTGTHFTSGLSRASFLASGAYVTLPTELDEGRVRITALGEAGQIRRLLRTFNKGPDGRIRYRVVSVTPARFGPDSPLRFLTEKQQEVLLTSYARGYYDVPRRTDSRTLAKRLGMRAPTFVNHRRKAELRVMREVLAERFAST
jgi:predicted DNA binding protein